MRGRRQVGAATTICGGHFAVHSGSGLCVGPIRPVLAAVHDRLKARSALRSRPSRRRGTRPRQSEGRKTAVEPKSLVTLANSEISGDSRSTIRSIAVFSASTLIKMQKMTSKITKSPIPRPRTRSQTKASADAADLDAGGELAWRADGAVRQANCGRRGRCGERLLAWRGCRSVGKGYWKRRGEKTYTIPPNPPLAGPIDADETVTDHGADSDDARNARPHRRGSVAAQYPDLWPHPRGAGARRLLLCRGRISAAGWRWRSSSPRA